MENSFFYPRNRLEEEEKVTTKSESMSRRSLNENCIISSSTGISNLCVYFVTNLEKDQVESLSIW